MADLRIVGPALARRVWEGMRNPSTRRVARKLRQAGASVSHMTVARWRNKGWRPLEREDHPLEVARAQLDDAVPLLNGDAMTTAKVLVEQAAQREKLEQLTDGKLLREAARDVAIAVIVVGRALMRQPETVVNKPGELAILFRALAACVQAASAANYKAPEAT
jgi:hypothetical protein